MKTVDADRRRAVLTALVLVCAAFLVLLENGRAVEPDPTAGPIGWASVDGGTTGGQGGKTVRVADAEALSKAVRGNEPRVVVVSGKIELSGDDVRVGSNKTIAGVGPESQLVGRGLHLSKVNNVIIRNLTLSELAGDAINVEGASHHIWIDHCDLSRGHDGLIDIKRGSDLITVSWCRLHDHHKTCLLGHSDKPSVLDGDRGKLRVTYHHNFFDGSQTRHPRVRVAETVHVFNNYYRRNEYGVASTNDAGVLVEGNYFERVPHPTHTRYGDSKAPGRLVARQNHTVDSGPIESAGTVREVPYKYTLDPAESIAELVSKHAGVK